MQSDDETITKTVDRMDHCGAHHHPVHPGQRHGGGPHPEHLHRQVHWDDGQPGGGGEDD